MKAVKFTLGAFLILGFWLGYAFKSEMAGSKIDVLEQRLALAEQKAAESSAPVAMHPPIAAAVPAPVAPQKPPTSRVPPRSAVPKPEASEKPPARSLVPEVSAPNGIAIGGGTVNNPTVNNFAPTPWRLDDAALASLTQIARDFPAANVHLEYPSYDAEGFRLGSQIRSALAKGGWNLDDKNVTTVMMSSSPAVGITFFVASKEDLPKLPLESMARLFINAGLVPAPVDVRVRGGLSEGAFAVRIGGRPK